jgi:acyl transferase domain-containing protein
MPWILSKIVNWLSSYAIGALSLESACKVAYYRGAVAAEVKANMSSKPGAMMSVNLSPSGVLDALRRNDLSSGSSTPIHIACVNSPYNCTLSGDEKAIDKVKVQLDKEGIFARKLTTGVSYHSPAMETVAPRYTDLIGSLQSAQQQPASIVMVSTVTGRSIEASAVERPEYWVRNLVQPVQFSEAISTLIINNIPNATDIIEIGPHHALGRPLRDILDQLPPRKTKTRCLYALDRAQSPMRGILQLVGQLFCRGYPVSISSANAAVLRSPGDLLLIDSPGYPFNHENEYWFESRISRDFRLRKETSGALLGQRASDWNPLEPSWRQVIDLDILPWLRDYSVRLENKNQTIELKLTEK